MLSKIPWGSMFKGFPTQKSKMSQEEEEGEGNEVHLGLPCGRQKYPIFWEKENLFSFLKIWNWWTFDQNQHITAFPWSWGTHSKVPSESTHI